MTDSADTDPCWICGGPILASEEICRRCGAVNRALMQRRGVAGRASAAEAAAQRRAWAGDPDRRVPDPPPLRIPRGALRTAGWVAATVVLVAVGVAGQPIALLGAVATGAWAVVQRRG